MRSNSSEHSAETGVCTMLLNEQKTANLSLIVISYAVVEPSVTSAQRVPVQQPRLNLSHIECTEEGEVLAHFVLLFAGVQLPGDLTGSYSGGTFGPVEPGKSSGNVWHYNVILPSGEIEVHNILQVFEVAIVHIRLHKVGPVALRAE